MLQQLDNGQRTSRNRLARSQRAVASAAFEALEGREMFSTYTVVNTLDSGAGSLRQALIDSTNHPNSGGPDVVAFNIPGNGVHTITPGMLLPEIFEAVTIDGYTQPGSKKNTLFQGNDGVQTIVINGQSSPLGTDGLNIYAGGTTVRGLAITKFASSVNGSGGDGLTLVAVNGGGAINVEGNAIYGNEGDGINVFSTAPGNTIGGSLPETRNMIYGNGLSGIELRSDGNTVGTNYIGTTPSGMAAAGNAKDGILICGSNNSVTNNLISANGASGVNLGDHALALDVTGNVVSNNDIGVNVDATAKLGNLKDGVHVVRFSPQFETKNNSILSNVISGNVEDGIEISGGCTDITIKNNGIGTDGTSKKALGNGFGIYLSDAHNISISDCTISGNFSGVYVQNQSSNVTLTNNTIGASYDHSTPIPNGDGITLHDASDVTIGGTVSGEGNFIAFNSGKGVIVTAGTGNSICGNAIFSNGGLQIDLGNNGRDTNDAGDLDFNIANHGQNFPVISKAEILNGQTHIDGSINGAPNTLYHIQLFISDTQDAGGAGQGKTLLSSFDILTNAFGDGAFGAASNTATPGYISAIATNALTSDSSEFSAAMKSTAGVGATGGSISGSVYEDVNGNDKRDGGETLLAGITVYVDENANGLLDAGEANGVSNAVGEYTIHESKDGSFTTRVSPPLTDIMTEHASGYPVTLNGGATNYSNLNFGLFKGGTISGTTFVDANGNGTKDAGEAALSGVKVTLDTNADGIVDATATSAADGAFQFSHLGPAVYRVRAIAPAATVQTSTNPNDVNNNMSGLTTAGANFGFKPQVVADVPVFLSDMNPTYACNGWGAYERDKSNGESGAHDGKAIKLDGVTFNKGLGVHAGSELKYALNGQYKHFVSKVGVDDEVGNAGSVIFQVFADGVKLFDSGKMTGSSPTKNIDVDVTGKGELRLVVTDAGDGNNCDHADWADANLTKSGVLQPPPGSFLSDLSNQPGAVNGWGAFERDKSNGESGAHDGKTLTINGKMYSKGLGVHAASTLVYNVPAGATHFLSDYGIDDEVGSNGTVIFKVYNAATNALLFSSTKMTGSDAAKSMDVAVSGVTQLKLVAEGTADGIANDHADWAAARFA